MGAHIGTCCFQGEKNAIRDCTNWAWIAVDSRGFSQETQKLGIPRE